MNESEYTAEELAEKYQISRQQAVRYIARFGADRVDLDHFLAAASRTARHRPGDVRRTASQVALG
jgi:predicted DNA-binding transcriptional regulator YafY